MWLKKITSLFKKKEETKLNTEERDKALEAFRAIKESASYVSCKFLDEYYKEAEEAISSFALTGQKVSLAKTKYLMDIVLKEKQLLDMGVNKCVSIDDVKRFCGEHESRVLMMCDVSDYERPLPKEAQEMIVKTKDIFDQFIVVYTDHTRAAAKKVEKARDPILFGIFLNTDLEVEKYDDGKTIKVGVMCERLYFLYDWEDEFCDLTLAKMLSESAKQKLEVKVTEVKEVEGIGKRVQGLQSISDASINF